MVSRHDIHCDADTKVIIFNNGWTFFEIVKLQTSGSFPAQVYR